MRRSAFINRVAAFFTILALAATAGSLEAQRFADYEVFFLEHWVVAVDVGDLDNDGDDDLALASESCFGNRPCDLVVYYQTDTGEISQPVFYPSPEGTSVAVADLDGDGLADVALATNPGVYLYSQQADGTLKPPEGPISQASSFKLRAGDFNLDGLSDLISLPFGFSTDDVVLLLQNSDGTVSEERYALEHHGFDDLKVADVDADGNLDVLTVSGQGTLRDNIGILHGDPRIRFRPQRRIDSGWTSTFDGVDAADFDADGDTDLAVLSGGVNPEHIPFVGFLHQDEAGVFSSTSRLPIQGSPRSIMSFDLDRNGLSDITVATGNKLTTWYQDCSGLFSFSETYDLPPGNYGNTHQTAAGDFNSDGIVDLAIASDNYGLVIFYGLTSEAEFDCSAGCDTGTDTDGDGTPDVCDLCEGFDDAEDADGDRFPDGCDPCLGENFTGDSDDDGFCDDLDLCQGDDATGDEDGDGLCGDIDPCTESPTTVCLREDRFEVTVDWRDFQGNTGVARSAVSPTEDSVLLWFFRQQNWEMLVKVLDGCNLNGHFWVFSAATTNVQYTLTVDDTATGDRRKYSNPLGNNADALTDTAAFATCQARSASVSQAASAPAARRSTTSKARSGAKENEWRHAGPAFSTVNAMAPGGPGTTTSYATTFLADEALLFVSHDGWESWSPAASPTGTRIDFRYADVAVDPRDPDVVYVATFGRGVLKSVDGGASWTSPNAGLPDPLLDQIQIDPELPDTVYAVAPVTGLFKTIDGGGSWRDVSPAPDRGNVGPLIIHPRHPRRLFLLTTTGLVKSLDGGATWVAAGIGLPEEDVYALAIDPGADDTLYAGWFDRIYRTTDALRWEVFASLPFGSSISSLAVDPADSSVLLAGIEGSPSETGVARGIDGGQTWELMGLRGEYITRLLHDARSPGTWLAATNSSLFKSTDGGKTWNSTVQGMGSSDIFSLATASSKTGIVYAGTGISTQAGRVFRTADGALSWGDAVAGDGGFEVKALAVHPRDSDVVFAGRNGAVDKSTDGGRSWRLIHFSDGGGGEQVTDLAIDPDNPDRLFVVAGQVLRSLDGGESWSVVLPFDGPTPGLSLALTPGDPDTVFLGTGSGIMKSVDGGETWEAIDPGIGVRRIDRLAISPHDPTTLFAVARGSPRLFKSTNGGVSWLRSDVGIPDGALTDVAIDPVENDALYVSHEGGSIYVSLDAGTSWQSLDPPIFGPTVSEPGRGQRPIRRLAIDGDRRLYAGTLGRGVFRLNLGNASEVLCPPDATHFCLNRDRFLVELEWRDFMGRSGAGQTAVSSEDSGVFWFFDPNNWEMLVKVLDACVFNNHFWVFAAATTNVEYTLKVTDVLTGRIRTYNNPLGVSAPSIIDTEAFATCTESP